MIAKLFMRRQKALTIDILVNKDMKPIYYKILISFLFFLIPIFCLGIFNTMVSKTYETINPNDCISLITKIDLCKSIRNMKIYLVIDIILIMMLLILKNKIIEKNVSKMP